MLKTTIKIIIVSSLVGCAGGSTYKQKDGVSTMSEDGRKRQAEYVEQQCNQDSMVGMIKSTNLLFKAKRDALNSAEAGLSITRKSELVQKLDGFDVRWQYAKNERDQTCRAYAACRFVELDTDGFCKSTRADNNEARKQMLGFITDLEALKIQ